MASPARYRPIRASLWVLYLGLAFGFCGLIIYGVLAGVFAERRVAAAEAGSSDPAECTRELGEIYRQVHVELEAQRSRPAGADGESAQAWSPVRTRLLALGKRCGLEANRGDALSRAYLRVLAFQRLAESAAAQYRHEVGPTDLEARRDLEALGIKPTE